MSDPSQSDDILSSADAGSGGADERTEQAGKTGPETPGAPSSDKPMTDSTDGGLEGGDPGVEE